MFPYSTFFMSYIENLPYFNSYNLRSSIIKKYIYECLEPVKLSGIGNTKDRPLPTIPYSIHRRGTKSPTSSLREQSTVPTERGKTTA